MVELLAFLGVTVAVICTPGQDTALTVRNTLFGGRRGGLCTAAGVSTGQAVWAVAAATGVAGLIRAAAPLLVGIQVLGAAYLVFLGVGSLRSAWRARTAAAGQQGPVDAAQSGATGSRAFRQGLVSNLANPKMAIFFISLLPQFATGSSTLPTMLAGGLVFCVLTFGWLALYGVVVGAARQALLRPRVRRWLDATFGCLLVGLGVRLAVAQT